MLRLPGGAAALAALLAAASPDGAAAQRVDLVLDASAAHARPPGEAPDAGPAMYGLLGARLRWNGEAGLLEVGAHGGRSAEADGGSWLEASAAGALVRRLGSATLAVRGEAFGLDYGEGAAESRFTYRILGAALRPELSVAAGDAVVRLRAEASRGGWSTVEPTILTGRPPGPPLPGLGDGLEIREADGGLAVTGGALELGRSFGAAWLRLTAERYHAENRSVAGRYEGVGADATVAAGPADLLLGARWWRSPDGAGGSESELGYQAGLGLELGSGVYARLDVGRSVEDPLHGSRGSLGATLSMSWRIGPNRARPPVPVVEVGGPVADSGRKVRFRLRAPEARTAAVAGDFTGWRPRPMRREDDVWTLEMVLRPGVHHFSFVLDGERWMVPADAPGIVDDGWGRKNASIVIEEG